VIGATPTRRWIARMAALSVLLAAAGCSYSYTLKAEDQDGRIVFVPEIKDGRNQGTGCFASFVVETLAGEVMWEWSTKGYKDPPCQNLLPVTYGVLPAGVDEITRAKPLKLGVVYALAAWDGDSYHGTFRLRQGVIADNLPVVVMDAASDAVAPASDAAAR